MFSFATPNVSLCLRGAVKACDAPAVMVVVGSHMLVRLVSTILEMADGSRVAARWKISAHSSLHDKRSLCCS